MLKAVVSVLVPGVVLAALVGCAADSQSSAAALPPKYLQVKEFDQCLQTEQVGTHQQWCLPLARPDACRTESWEQLQKLQFEERMPVCI